MGRHEEARAQVARALEMDPLSPLVLNLAALVAYWGRDYRQALELARRGQEIEPGFMQSSLGLALAALGRHEEGIADLRRAAGSAGGASSPPALRGGGRGVAGRHEEARQIARQLEERSRSSFVPPLFIAWVHIGLDARQAAFDWLER